MTEDGHEEREVTRTQDAGNEEGTWFHIKVSAGSNTILYSLTCDEFLSIKKGWTLRCFQVSAGKDYSVRKFPTAINFWPLNEEGPGAKAMYEIVSEKEK